MTILEAAAAPQDADFLIRVQYCIVKAAIAVTNEDVAYAKHPQRLILARAIIQSQEDWAKRFALGVMTNATLLAETSFAQIDDSDLQFAVNEIYDAFLTR